MGSGRELGWFYGCWNVLREVQIRNQLVKIVRNARLVRDCGFRAAQSAMSNTKFESNVIEDVFVYSGTSLDSHPHAQHLHSSFIILWLPPILAKLLLRSPFDDLAICKYVCVRRNTEIINGFCMCDDEQWHFRADGYVAVCVCVRCANILIHNYRYIDFFRHRLLAEPLWTYWELLK